ncbi:PAS domain-containing sensor histidine kinase [Pedobacter sp. D749]|uniref:sensor histidine kinase n=1 Tax=Pedobacter sp. D749 TaxID=2856523 RepID=UPI001C5A3296|nr:ATP-binding protein [Pedobacter sp. D749]QXU43542.1 ATP-binding protein [Pedobacter sp. D749]
MKLKTKYILFLVLLHLICLVMSYFIFKENKLIFLLAEVFIIISILISLSLYKQLIAPLSYLSQGVSAIKDKDFNVKFLSTGKKEVDELVDVYNRMIDELRTERTKQQEQHFFLEKLIQTSPTGIIILDYDKQVKQINPKATEILNNNQHLIENQIYELKTGSSKVVRVNGVHTYKIQKSRFIDRGFERIFIMIEEVTAEIFAAEKGVYNKVIRMMAHEVNNTVGPVNSIINTALSQENLWLNEQDYSLKNALKVAVDRNQNLNIFMRNFADLVKLPAANRKRINLVELIKSVTELMYFPANEKNIKIDFEGSHESYFIPADVEQMEQALINIIKNAIEAIENTGKITLTLDQSKQMLTISDTGKGISQQDTEQLFSPFFSTKKDGQGIGLTLVREILLNHGFDFSLKTIQPNETQFSIKFISG